MTSASSSAPSALPRRNVYKLTALSLIAVSCNEVLGLQAGTLRNDDGGGGAAGASGGAMVPGGGTTTSAGSEPTGATSARGGNERGGEAGGAGDIGNGGRGADTSGGGGDAGDAGSGGDEACSSTIDCKERGVDWPYLCVNGKCVDVTSSECSTVLGADWVETSPEDEPYLIGAYANFDVARRDSYPFFWSMKFAMQEFADFGPIPIDGVERRPVMILCDSPLSGDMARMFRGLAHLIDSLEISAVLMFPPRIEMVAAAQYAYVSNGKDVFFLDVGGATRSMLTLPDGGRLWHMLGDSFLLALSYVPLVERVEERVNPGASSGGAARPTRLVLVTNPLGDAYESEVAEHLDTLLRINGVPLDEALGTYRKVVAGSGAWVTDVSNLEPDIVIDFGNQIALQTVTDAALQLRGTPLPFYIFPSNRWLSDALLNAVHADASLRTRVVGINYAAAENPTLYNRYLERVQAFAPDVDLRGTDNVYDSVYFLIYSAVAGGSGGTKLSEGMKRLVARSPRRNVGPGENMRAVLSRLAMPDATLSLYGTMGPPDFHLPTGGRVEYGSVWCIDESVDWALDVLRYDPATQKLGGDFTCFEF